MELNDYLATMAEQAASDLYLSVGAPPSIKVHGKLTPLHSTPLTAKNLQHLAYSAMNEQQKATFNEHLEMNLALDRKAIGRFRVNIFYQRGEIALVARHIKTDIPTMEALGLPKILKSLAAEQQGLILFVGATGTGKSTSLAAMIEHRSTTQTGHIITVEDPIEYVHEHKLSMVNQREIGFDTKSYENALQNTLRQAPDVILIGEIRTQETMQHAIAFSETGHLCLSTLHANNSNQAFERIINFFPKTQHNHLLLDLSLNLKSIISQRLIPTTDNRRIAAFEILINTPLISDLIKKSDIMGIKEIMEKSEHLGMQTFDDALYKLYKTGHITLKNALRYSDSANNLQLKISLEEGINEKELADLALDEDQEESF